MTLSMPISKICRTASASKPLARNPATGLIRQAGCIRER